MSRPIEFRAWDGKKIVTDFDIDGSTGIPILNESQTDPRDLVLLQYTGLKDKNDVKIFEGDIVKVKAFKPDTYEVVFNRGGFCMRHSKDDVYYPDCKYLEDGIIIGNIYENKELLTDTDDDPLKDAELE